MSTFSIVPVLIPLFPPILLWCTGTSPTLTLHEPKDGTAKTNLMCHFPISVTRRWNGRKEEKRSVVTDQFGSLGTGLEWVGRVTVVLRTRRRGQGPPQDGSWRRPRTLRVRRTRLIHDLDPGSSLHCTHLSSPRLPTVRQCGEPFYGTVQVPGFEITTVLDPNLGTRQRLTGTRIIDPESKNRNITYVLLLSITYVCIEWEWFGTIYESL